MAKHIVSNEPALWLARESIARAAVTFWNRFLILRMGFQHDQPLDPPAIERLVTIVRAVSWVESKHGTATTNQGARDPMQCGHPQDAWWKQLITPGHPGQDRFITGPGGSNYFAGDLPAAAEQAPGFPTQARVSALADKTRGHDDALFNEQTSYFWGVPILIHKTNAVAGVQTFKCGDLSRDRLIAGAVAYNGGGDPKYRDKILEALALSGVLPAALALAARAIAGAPTAEPPLSRVVEAVDALVADVAARRGIARIRGASLTLGAAVSDGTAWLVPKSAATCTIALRVTPPSTTRRVKTGAASEDPEFAAVLEALLHACARGSRGSVTADIEVPLDIDWTGTAVRLKPAGPERR